mmetsp:Transcript_80246/g.186341  ORF Transcript_80246/g.186341 Transcript_80246/m.186341 type:complete len:226 (-) Transcript_80246:138-815(-)
MLWTSCCHPPVWRSSQLCFRQKPPTSKVSASIAMTKVLPRVLRRTHGRRVWFKRAGTMRRHSRATASWGECLTIRKTNGGELTSPSKTAAQMQHGWPQPGNSVRTNRAEISQALLDRSEPRTLRASHPTCCKTPHREARPSTIRGGRVRRRWRSGSRRMACERRTRSWSRFCLLEIGSKLRSRGRCFSARLYVGKSAWTNRHGRCVMVCWRSAWQKQTRRPGPTW